MTIQGGKEKKTENLTELKKQDTAEDPRYSFKDVHIDCRSFQTTSFRLSGLK